MLSRSAKKFTTLAFLLATPSLLLADFTYQETTQITGGSMLGLMKMAGMFSSQARKSGDPVVSTLYLKDNRLARVTADSIEIIDLDAETITHIDVPHKSYTVMTFEQMREQMRKASEQMQKSQDKAPAQPAAKPDDPKVDVSFDVKVRNTGAQKQVSGLSASESILTMTMNATDQKSQQSGAMAVTNDMWMVPEIPGYGQVREFYKRMAEKMGSVLAAGGMDFSRFLAQNPGATSAMADMAKEMQKLKGVPVMQVTRMGTTINGQPLPAASEAPLPPDSTPPPPSKGDMLKSGAASMIGGHFGLGGFGKKKQDQDPAPAQNSASGGNAPATAGILMESQTTTSEFNSNPVDASHFGVPAGFKQVQVKQ